MGNKKIIITKGLPGSGKSHWAIQQIEKNPETTVNINRDDLREMFHRKYYSKDNERFVTKARDLLIKEAIRNPNIETIIVSDTNLAPANERRIRELAGPDIPVEVIFFNTDLAECLRRNEKRLEDAPRDYVPPDVIKKMAKQWEEWKNVDCSVTYPEVDPVEWVDGLPEAVWVDMDGCLAHNTSGRSYYDWKRCEEDEIDPPVQFLVTAMYNAGYDILVVSGRDGICRPETEKWLQNYSIPYVKLFMREVGDTRKDSIVKCEIFDNFIRGKWNILFALDDRTQVVNALRKNLGLKVLQVAPGDF